MLIRRVAALVILLVVTNLIAACGALGQAIDSNPVWASDGYVYYQKHSFDGPLELWRRGNGGDAKVVRHTPAEVSRDATCDGSADWRLFAWPSGSLGVEYDCNDGASYYFSSIELRQREVSSRLVVKLNGVGSVAWQNDGQDALASQGRTCFGLSRLVDGSLMDVPGPVQLEPSGAWIDTDATASCAGIGALPVTAPDSRYWGFLYASGFESRAELSRNHDVAWQLYLWRRGAKSPKAVGSAIKNPLDAALNANRDLMAISSEVDGGCIFMINVNSGNIVRTIKSGGQPTFSPDGREIAYVTSGGELAVVRLA